jgi:predicted DCC family thiol-disulfide oxidoreductase YuxK
VLFDGVCDLCSGAVRWLLERDPERRLRFASLQSDAARRALTAAGVPDPARLPDSIVLLDEAGVHVRSGAVLRIARHLGLPYSLSWVGMAVPRPVRDGIYGWMARRRYR